VDGTTLLIGSIVLLAILMALWARGRAARIRSDADGRERRALAAVRAGGDPTGNGADTGSGPAKPAESTGETIFEPGTPTSMVPGRRGSIEVAEVLDIEELLRDEPHGIASRARAQLEEHTNIHTGDTLPPRPIVSEPVALAPTPARVVPQPPMQPTRSAPPVTPALAAQRQPAPARAQPAPSRATPARAPAPAPAAPDGEVPLRELVLAWFEARGYRAAPASPVVRPIELVLRHKDDPSRAYAFVVGTQRVTSERVHQLAQQARGIGLIRVLVVADAGLSADAPQAKKGVRVLDRNSLSAELAKLDISVAAKIIAVARKRSSARASVA
jgi:hypothetical protein